MDSPLDDGDFGDEPTSAEPTMAEHHQTYTALLQTLRSAMRDSNATRDSPVLQSLIRDLCYKSPIEEDRPFIHHDNFYQQIRHNQNSPLSQLPIPSAQDLQAAAKAQDMLHLQMLDGIEGGLQGGTTSISDADIDDLLIQQCDTDIPIPR
ncbi:hypothetical protein NW759_016508 [Fusarium solani]|nr:hypothetical protein NW759_016508 [Fusarium solani]